MTGSKQGWSTGPDRRVPVVAAVAAFAAGALVVPILGPFAPGPLGAFGIIVAAGILAGLASPGWSGLLSGAAGLSAYATFVAAQRGFAGLDYLSLAIFLPMLALGAVGGTIVRRVAESGVRVALADVRLWAALVAGTALAAADLWFYISLVTSDSPP